jgi:NAD(P)-dependent dehydrogenase (short-subunit alcohol dehydrogenase family)
MTTPTKTALVTGASRGIGRATAQALAKQGVRILVHFGNSAKEADSLVNEIPEVERPGRSIQNLMTVKQRSGLSSEKRVSQVPAGKASREAMGRINQFFDRRGGQRNPQSPG